MCKNLPLILGRLREARGWGRNELADIAGLSRQTIANYESGATTPKIGDAAKLADVLGISLDQLAGRVAIDVVPPESEAFDIAKISRLAGLSRRDLLEALLVELARERVEGEDPRSGPTSE